MRLFEERVETLFTDGPAVVLKVEQRREPRARSLFDTRGVEWEEYGVVIFTAKAMAAPMQKAGEWVMPETAHETRFVLAAHSPAGVEVPPSAGKLLGHFRQNGQKWWVFLEKLGAETARPRPGARPRSDSGSPTAPAAPSAASSRPDKPSASPSAQPPGSPRNTSTPGRP